MCLSTPASVPMISPIPTRIVVGAVVDVDCWIAFGLHFAKLAFSLSVVSRIILRALDVVVLNSSSCYQMT